MQLDAAEEARASARRWPRSASSGRRSAPCRERGRVRTRRQPWPRAAPRAQRASPAIAADGATRSRRG